MKKKRKGELKPGGEELFIYTNNGGVGRENMAENIQQRSQSGPCVQSAQKGNNPKKVSTSIPLHFGSHGHSKIGNSPLLPHYTPHRDRVGNRCGNRCVGLCLSGDLITGG